MELNIASASTEMLISSYKETDAALKKQLIGGVIWLELKDKINHLIGISKELSKRNVSLDNFCESKKEGRHS
ncbi:MAG TPA: hypothetical protein VF144_18710 [Chitinophagaceae bacterium]